MSFSEEDMVSLSRFRRQGIVQKLKEVGSDHRLAHSEGIILVACGDKNRCRELIRYMRVVTNDTPIHLILNPGGTNLIPPSSPLANDGVGNFVLMMMERAVRLQGLRTVALFNHWPCGAALEADISLEMSVNYLVRAKETVKFALDRFLDLKVACFLHCDFNETKKRTYFVSATKWREHN